MERQKGNDVYFPKLHNEKKCRRCGKTVFITPWWVYKGNQGSYEFWFCSYTCMRRFEESKQEKRKYTKIKGKGGQAI